MNVLIMRLSSLGDVTLLFPILRAIKSANPQAKISCVTKPSYAPLLALSPEVSRVYSYQGFSGTLKELNSEKWDVVLDLHGVLRTRLLSFALPAQRKAVYAKDIWKRRFLVFLKLFKGDKFLHALDRYAQGAAGAGLIKDFKIPSHAVLSQPSSEIRLKVDNILKGQDFFVGIAPGARWGSKKWPAERFAQTISLLKEKYPAIRPVLMGDSHERTLCQEIASHLKNLNPINTAGELKVGELPYFIGKLRLFLSNDSGLMHMASLLGVPTVAAFGPTVREFGFTPAGQKSRVVEIPDLACRPCTLHGSDICPRGHFLCMRLITPDQVMKEALVVSGVEP